MERNVSFETRELTDIIVRLAWAQLDIFADDVEKIQVMAAGDENSAGDLRIGLDGESLLIEQPQYGLSLNLMDSRWLQVCIRVPKAWQKGIHCSTISGLLSARKLEGDEVQLETVTGELRALKLRANELSLKTVSGDARGEELSARLLSVRSVSGDMALEALTVRQLKCTSISGEQTYHMAGAFERVDVTAVSGDVMISSPADEINASLRSLSGHIRTEGVTLTERADAPTVRITGVSADLKLIGIKE